MTGKTSEELALVAFHEHIKMLEKLRRDLMKDRASGNVTPEELEVSENEIRAFEEMARQALEKAKVTS